MQTPLRLGLSCTLIVFLGACGSATPQKPVAAPTPVSTPLQQLPPAPQLTPIPSPAGLVGVGRLVRPGDLTKTLAGWVSLPFEPSMIDALQPGLSQAVAFDAPVEFAFVLPESENSQHVKPQLVVTVGLSSLDRARGLLEEYLGTKLIDRGSSVYVTPEEAKLHCAIAPSLGKAASRLVCSDKPATVDQLLPYATRGLPLEDLGAADLHAELRFEPLRQKFAAVLRMGRTMAVPAMLKELSLNDARFDRPFADVAHAVGDELIDLFDDADKLSIDVGLSGKPEQVDLKMTLAYRGRTSFISLATADAQRRMIPPPGQFFDLPQDSAVAGYIAAADPKRLDKPRVLVEALVEGLLSHFEVGAALRRDVRSALDAVFQISSPMVIASGPVSPRLDKASPSAAARVSLALGWRLYGIEAPAAPYQAAIKTLVKLSADRAFRRGLDDLTHRGSSVSTEGDGKQKGRAIAATKNRGTESVQLKSRTLAGMPAGSEIALIEFSPDAAKQLMARAGRRRGKAADFAAAESLTCLLAVVPDGGRTWFVFAMDEKSLIERAKLAVSSSKEPRLATRNDLTMLRGQSANQAGFSTLMLAKGWLQYALMERGKSAKEADTLLSTLPHHGTTPMPYRTVVVGDDKHHAVEISTSIPRAVFDDAAAAVPTLMTLMPD